MNLSPAQRKAVSFPSGRSYAKVEAEGSLCEICNSRPARFILKNSLSLCCSSYAYKCSKTPSEGSLCYGCGLPATLVQACGFVCGRGENVIKCPEFAKKQREIQTSSFLKRMENPDMRKQRQEKFEATMMERYNVPCAFASDEIRKKALSTMQKRYGVTSGVKIPHAMDKAKAKFEKEYGVSHWTQLASVKEKRKRTCTTKYGVSHTMPPSKVNSRRDNNPQRYGIVLSREEWLSRVWNKLRLAPTSNLPEKWNEKSHTKFMFLCDCGRAKAIRFDKVANGSTKSCKKCNSKPTSEWLSKTFGSLKLNANQELPEDIGLHSHKFYLFCCACGGETTIAFKLAANGNTASCGRCSIKSKEYWLGQRWGMLKLDPSQELPEEWPPCSGIFRFLCDCGNTPMVGFSSITGERTQSCGCAHVGKSPFSPAMQIHDFIKPLMDEVQFSYWWKTSSGSRREYDVFLPSMNLAIEYHGLYWHMEDKVAKNDYRKYKESQAKNTRLIQIYEDEWRDKPNIMKDMLKALIQPSAAKRIKPEFEVHYETPKEARDFLDKYHYLGGAGGCVTICASHKGEIVGVWVFMKREAGTVLWHRACWHPAYKAWNPHEKALSLALPEL